MLTISRCRVPASVSMMTLSLAALAAAASLAAGAAMAPLPGGPRSAARPFSDAVADADGSLRLQVRAGAFDELKTGVVDPLLELPLDAATTVTLELSRFSVTREDTQFLIGGPAGPTPMPAPDVLLYRGRVRGEPNSNAFLAFSAAGTANGYLTRQDGERYFVSTGGHRVTATAAGAAVTVHRAQSGATWREDIPFCGVSAAHDLRVAAASGAVAGAASGPRGPRVLFVAVETDQEFYQLFNDSTAAQAYIVQVIGAVSDIYQRDFDAKLVLTFSRLWPAGGEPFGADNLDGFANYWFSNEDPSPYHLIHLMSGRRDLAYGGIAYVAGSCSGSAFAIGGFLLGSFPTPVDEPNLGNWDVVVVAHEMGHNMGTFHTHDGYTPPIDTCGSNGAWARGEIMSYCHTTPGGLLNIEMRFSKRVQDVVRGDVELNDCQFFDCNGNNISDAVDIAGGAPDVNGNGFPDVCEDCNNNSILDPADIAGGMPDINGNGVPDMCEPDCNGNSRPDPFDISNFGAADANANLIPDSCEPDCDDDTFADFVEIKTSAGALDLDRNSVLDSCQDCDANGTTDWRDLLRPGNVYVADLTDYVREYHAAAGVAVATHGAGGILFDPYDVTFGPDRMAYVASRGNSNIVRIDPDAGTSAVFIAGGGVGLSAPSALTFGPNGNLFVSSLTANNVMEFNGTTGAFVRNFVAAGSGGLASPYGLTFGPNGNLFVAGGNRVNEYDGSTGAFVRNFVAPGAGGLSDPRGITFTPDGRLLVVNRASGTILAYNAAGASLGVFNNDGYAIGQPWGIRIGPNGNVFVTRASSGARIVEYDVIAGRYLRSFIRADAQMIQPTGFAFRPESPVDCNANAVLDVCDIAGGLEEDLNGNNIPDACEPPCIVVSPIFADADGIRKNRYLTLDPIGVEGGFKAIRVTFADLPPPFEAFEGQHRWVGPVQDLYESPSSTFKGATLQCEPYYSFWTEVGGGMLAVFDEAIVPGANYDLQTISDTCDAQSEASYSPAVGLATAVRWGDIIAPFNPPSPTTQPDIADVSAMVDKFRNAAGAAVMARADVYPNLPDQDVNFSDISLVVDAYKGVAYTLPGPAPCP